MTFWLSGKVVALHLDNSTAKAYLCNHGETHLLLEGYFLQNRIIFDSVDKLSPVSNMAYSCLKKC